VIGGPSMFCGPLPPFPKGKGRISWHRLNPPTGSGWSWDTGCSPWLGGRRRCGRAGLARGTCGGRRRGLPWSRSAIRRACVAVSFRKATYNYGCLVARRAFTVSVPSESQAEEADYFGLASGRDVDKFAAAGWTPVRSELVDAPYVAECPLVLECKVVHVFELGLHTQFVGQILDVKADEKCLDAAGMLDIAKVRPIVVSPGDRKYYKIGGLVGQGFALGKDVGKGR
jgi:flavin reductase (DIM6/NTAB) family NADH-FMN oxidoreductase RutF